MQKYFNYRVLVLAILACIFMPKMLFSQIAVKKYESYFKLSTQVILVTASNWNAIQGTMHLYERTQNDQPWKLIREFPVTLGRSGLAFDRNSSLPKPDDVLFKKEGDGKSPVGLFKLGPVFSSHSLEGLKMPFKKTDTTDICVDDIHSTSYNTWVNTNGASKKDWKSFEYMKSQDDSYEYGVWVQYNSEKIFSGNGSCIFLHVWSGSTSPTSGCTAMEKQNIISVINWLDASSHPVLLQLVEER